MWQSSMLISLLVLSHEQIYFVLIWVNHDSSYRGPITLLEPLVVLIGRHEGLLVKRSNQLMGLMNVLGGNVGIPLRKLVIKHFLTGT